MTRNDEEHRDLSWLFTTLDCGDNSCAFIGQSKRVGMRTNGGCRCLSDLSPATRYFVMRMFNELVRLHNEK